jgi:hypothetical protein
MDLIQKKINVPEESGRTLTRRKIGLFFAIGDPDSLLSFKVRKNGSLTIALESSIDPRK